MKGLVEKKHTHEKKIEFFLQPWSGGELSNNLTKILDFWSQNPKAIKDQ